MKEKLKMCFASWWFFGYQNKPSKQNSAQFRQDQVHPIPKSVSACLNLATMTKLASYPSVSCSVKDRSKILKNRPKKASNDDLYKRFTGV